jgi:phosphatidate cytidylyltransferase
MSNLQKRLVTGGALIVAMAGILFGDGLLDPQKRFLPFCMVLFAVTASLELMTLLSIPKSGAFYLIPIGLCAIIVRQWGAYYTHEFDCTPTYSHTSEPPVIAAFTLLIAGLFLLCIIMLTDDPKIGRVLFAFVYLGVPALMLLKLQHMAGLENRLALAATIFVPKFGDVGAYFTGRLIGKHKMAPRISPNKTWEGFAGGMAFATLTAIVINHIDDTPLFPAGDGVAALFGLIVGVAGVLGDLFESLIKRRAHAKDASASVPGFGGVLDVVDSVLFAAPVAYIFFVVM